MEKKYIIKYGDKEFEASEYQAKIFDAIEYGVGNIIINAAAGSSKTTSLVNAINYISNDKKVLFVAFNKDIAEKIREMVKRENTDVHTFHSLGRSLLIENNIITNETPINDYKYNIYIKENINNLTKEGETKSLKRQYNHYINNIIKLTEYCRYFHYMKKNKINSLVKMYGIELVRDEIDVVINVLKWGQTNFNEIDYTDMIWLPVQLNLTTKRKLYDFIFVDEAQDTSIVEQELVFKTFKRGARFCTCGDNFQQINLWCGANKEAIDNFRKLPNTEDFYLPISYRCPKKIVELASNFSDNIIAAPNAIEGEIKYNVNINFAQSNDMVLCRTTAPLIKQHLSFLRNNKKSFIRGFETIKTDLLNLIDNSHSKTIDKNMLTKDGLFSRVYENMINVGEGLKKQFNLSEEEMVVHPTILTIYDNIQCLAVLSEGLNTVEELKEKINTIFNGDSNDAIQLSTIHKAKGLEADNVYILCPESLPSPIARLDWERETERNLQYVAYTRAKKTLNFVADDNSFMWVRFKAQFSPKAMKELFDKCRNTLKYNNEMDISEDVIDITLQKRKQIRELGSNVTPIQTITNKKQKGGLKFAKLMQ